MSTLKSALAGLAVAAGLAAGVAKAKEISIAMVTHGQASDPFWAIVKRGADDAAKQAGVTLSYRAPETFDMTQMANLVRAAANQRPDGLVVSIPDADALAAPLRDAEAAGITVIGINGAAATAHKLGAVLEVGQEEEAAGKAAGERLKQLGGKKGVCINHEVGNVGLDQRCRGFAAGFGGPTQVLPTGMDPAETSSKLRALLQSDPAIDSLLSLNAPVTGEPAVQVVDGLGKTGSVRVGGFDLSPGFLKAVQDGHAAFAVDQQPYLQGYLPVAILALKAKYGLMPAGDIPSGPNLVGKDQAGQAIELAGQGIR